MIKRVIERVTTLFSRKPRKSREPKRIGADVHGINQELVARSALRVCETLQKAGFRAYLVGGAVRDLLLGVAPRTSTSRPMPRRSRSSRISGARSSSDGASASCT